MLATCMATLPCTVMAAPTLTVTQYGPGNVLVDTAINGLEIDIDPEGTPPSAAILEWQVPVPDGDLHGWRRRIPLGTATSKAWVYAPGVSMQEVQGTVRLLDADTGDVLAHVDPAQGAQVATIVDPGTQVILVVGHSRVGLETYDQSGITSDSPSWTNISTVVRTLDPEDLPDRPEALDAVSTIVWTGDTQGLTAATASALRAWIERGGHFIVSLPTHGDPWRLNAAEGGLLSDLLGSAPSSRELPLSVLSPLLSPDVLRTQGVKLPGRLFPDDQVAWHGLHRLASGQMLTVTRPEGFGHVTVTGLDLTTPRLSSIRTESGEATGPLPWATTFWNPVLGRISTAPTPSATTLEDDGGTFAQWSVIDDRPMASGIERRVAAGGRLLAVVGALGLYWLVAVPLIWRVLRRGDRRHLAWPVFAGVALICAAVLWAVAQSLAIQDASIRHLTVLDQVAGRPAHRVASWFTLASPSTGTEHVDVEWIDGERPAFYSWLDQAQRRVSFPATQTIEHDLTDVGRVEFVSRATTNSFMLDWTGVVDPDDWGGLFRVLSPVSVVRDTQGGLDLRGVIVSMLPSNLEDVSMLLIDEWTDEGPRGVLVKVSSGLQPGVEINFETFDLNRSLAGLDSQFEHLILTLPWASHQPTEFGRRAQLQALSFFSILPDHALQDMNQIRPRRSIGSELDLGPSMRQPVLVITGFLPSAPFPVDVELGGERVQETEGDVMVRWIHPLTGDNPIESHHDGDS